MARSRLEDFMYVFVGGVGLTHHSLQTDFLRTSVVASRAPGRSLHLQNLQVSTLKMALGVWVWHFNTWVSGKSSSREM